MISKLLRHTLSGDIEYACSSKGHGFESDQEVFSNGNIQFSRELSVYYLSAYFKAALIATS